MPSSNVSRPNWKVSQAFVDHLLALLDHWGDNGNTVVVIEHHQAVMPTPTTSSTWARGRTPRRTCPLPGQSGTLVEQGRR